MRRQVPPIILNLIVINVLFYISTYLLFPKFDLVTRFALWPPGTDEFHVWQPITYMFMHAKDFTHILFNMLGLWMFGADLEQFWGPKRFLNFYLLCGLGGAALHLIISHFIFHSYGPMLGASGAVFGVLAAFGLTFPNREMISLFLPIPIKAKYWTIGYAVMELYFGIRSGDNVAHFAHLGGMAVGIVLVLIYRRMDKR